MGRQAKIKEERRAMRLAKQHARPVGVPAQPPEEVESPPDLGVSVEEAVNTNDKFGG